MLRLISSVLLGYILFISTFVFGQDMSFYSAISKPKETIVDSLPNGLRYYIKENDKPQDKIEVRLVFRLGSVQEEKGEEGVAHFLEHMALEGSKNYPENAAIQFWESLGAKFGTSINAYTGYDRTVYVISIPSGEREGDNLKKTLHILRDWLTSLSLKDANIQKQKKIICEEIAGYISPNETDELKKGNSSKLKRLPVGTKEQIATINREKILHFYKKWYKPQNTAIVVVGKVSPKETESEIRSLFTDLAKGEFESKNEEDIIYGASPLFFAQEDSLASSATLSLLTPFRYEATHSLGDLLDERKTEFAIKLLNQRLREKDLSVSRYWYLQKTGFLEFSMEGSKDIKDQFKRGMAAVEGIKKTGVTQEEITSLLPEFLDEISSMTFERNSENWADSFVEMFIFNEKQLASDEDKLFIVSELSKLTIEEWSAEVRKVIAFHRPDLVIYRFNSQKHQKLDYDAVAQLIIQAHNSPDTSVYSPKVTSDEKVKLPNHLESEIEFNPKMISRETYYPSVGIYFIELTNGAKLYLKPTRGDERFNLNISFKGGLALLPKAKFKQMEELISYIGLGGTRRINYDTFSDILTQEEISFVNTNENYFHGMMAAAPIKKAKLLTNLVIEKIIEPELCYDDFEEIKEEMIQEAQRKDMRRLTPEKELDRQIERLKGNILPMTEMPLTVEEVEKIDLDSLYAYYKAHYITPEDMICIATGDFDVDTIKHYLAGGLSVIEKKRDTTKLKNEHFDFLQNKESQCVERQDSKGRLDFNIIYYGEYENNLHNQLILKLMRDALRNRLLVELREKKGLVYSPYVELDFKAYPSSVFFFNINGETSAVNVSKVEDVVADIFLRLKENPIGIDELEQMKRSFLVVKKDYLDDRSSAHWRDYLLDSFRTAISIDEIASYEKILASLTVEDIQKAFNQIIKNTQKVNLYLGDCSIDKTK